MKSKIIIGIVAAVAILGGGYTVSRMNFIGTGKVGIVYNYKDGVQDTVLTPGMHFIAPMNKVKEFSTSNEILVLTKDKRDGSKEDDSFKVATSDDASIAVSFWLVYEQLHRMCVKFGHIFHGYTGMEITPYLVFTADGVQILQNKTQSQRMVLSSHWHIELRQKMLTR